MIQHEDVAALSFFLDFIPQKRRACAQIQTARAFTGSPYLARYLPTTRLHQRTSKGRVKRGGIGEVERGKKKEEAKKLPRSFYQSGSSRVEYENI